MNEFAFHLGQTVAIQASGEQGLVIARAEYTNCVNRYFIRYRNANGLAVEAWWDEDALHPVIPQ